MEYQEIKELKKEKQILVNVCFFNEKGILINNRVPMKNVSMKIDGEIITLDQFYSDYKKTKKALNNSFSKMEKTLSTFIEKQKQFNKSVFNALKVNLAVTKEIKEEQV